MKGGEGGGERGERGNGERRKLKRRRLKRYLEEDYIATDLIPTCSCAQSRRCGFRVPNSLPERPPQKFCASRVGEW